MSCGSLKAKSAFQVSVACKILGKSGLVHGLHMVRLTARLTFPKWVPQNAKPRTIRSSPTPPKSCISEEALNVPSWVHVRDFFNELNNISFTYRREIILITYRRT
jgi:hypothetical protein